MNDRPSTFVPARPAERSVMAYPIVESEAHPLSETHLQALETIKETATPFDRAVAFGVRLLLLCVLWLVLAGGLLFWMNGEQFPLIFLVFVALCSLSYIWLNGQDLENSAVGLERHKADLAHDLAVRKLEDDGQRKDRLLDAYLKKMLDGEG